MRNPALPASHRATPRVLIAGREGQLARALLPAFENAGWQAVALGRPALDLAAGAKAITEAVAAMQPDLVVNAAAYTAVDRAEEERDAAYAINAQGAGILATAAALQGAAMLHVSTDYVFDGRKGAPYTEDDATCPLGAYGATKLAGEEAVMAANPRSAIIRTSWSCSATGANFLRTMLRLAQERESVAVVADQRGAPSFADDLAAAMLRVGGNLLDAAAGAPQFGIFHLAGAPDTSWHGFAAAIFDQAAQRGWKRPQLRAITTDQYPTRAQRPADSRLDCSRILAVHGVRRATWDGGLSRALDRLIGPVPVSIPQHSPQLLEVSR